jgi:Fe2+ or Zn2+ uptake regulation protein
MNTQILNFINEETNREMLEEKTTKEVAVEFGLTVEQAYKELSQLYKQNLIVKLEAVNSTKFDYCGWIRLND